MMRRLIFVSVLATVAAGGGPAQANEQSAVPRSATATVAPMAVASSAATLPDPSDPSWSKVFEDGFTQTHVATTDADPNYPAVYTTPEGRAIWRNIGSDKVINNCATVDTTGVGILTVKAVPRNAATATHPWRCRLTSTTTFGGGTYVFAARVKTHQSSGNLSSFWLNSALGGPYNEIDVIEDAGVVSHQSGCKASATLPSNHGTADGPYYGLNHTYYSTRTPADVGRKYCLPQGRATALHDGGFHTFHVEWTPGVPMRFYIDGELSAEFEAKYSVDSPLTAILTNVDKQNGSATSGFQVDWVKVWKKNPPPPPPACTENECFRAQLGAQAYTYRPGTNPADPLQARIVFDSKFYAATYPDVVAWANGKVASQGGNFYDHVQWHWLHYGIQAGRSGSATFDPQFYMQHNPDVAQAYGTFTGAAWHYVNHGRFEGRRGSIPFDAGWYRSRYGDLAGWDNASVLDHFTVYGLSEGRQGAPEFAPAWYMGVNADLRNAFGANNYRAGLSHWYANGRDEKRPGAP